MIIKVVEGEISWLPELKISDFPEMPSSIKIHLKSDVLGLEPIGVVGSIPLINNKTLQIIPKIGEINFLRLLLKAEGSQIQLENKFNEFVSYAVDDEKNVFSIIARNLLSSVSEILHRSPIQGRIRKSINSDFIQGNLHIEKTLINLATKKAFPISSIIKQRTFDIPENRVITECVIIAWIFLPNSQKHKFKITYENWLKKFPRSKNLELDLSVVEKRFSSRGYRGPRDYYHNVLMLCKILLGINGIGGVGKEYVHGDALLLNTADIFEKYIRQILCDAYSKEGYVVCKGVMREQSLYSDGRFWLIPDVIMKKENKPLLIIDAKYKKPDASDHYQMLIYLNSYNLKYGFLIAPNYIGTEIEVKDFLTFDKRVVREIYLPMQNLPLVEETLSSLIRTYSLS